MCCLSWITPTSGTSWRTSSRCAGGATARNHQTARITGQMAVRGYWRTVKLRIGHCILYPNRCEKHRQRGTKSGLLDTRKPSGCAPGTIDPHFRRIQPLSTSTPALTLVEHQIAQAESAAQPAWRGRGRAAAAGGGAAAAAKGTPRGAKSKSRFLYHPPHQPLPFLIVRSLLSVSYYPSFPSCPYSYCPSLPPNLSPRR